ncbi:hypothetical protein OFN66_30145, partial [Escherichia coli]|nr:hypothetical protein [Escherichia coli]
VYYVARSGAVSTLSSYRRDDSARRTCYAARPEREKTVFSGCERVIFAKLADLCKVCALQSSSASA